MTTSLPAHRVARVVLAGVLLLSTAACVDKKEKERADSATAAAAEQLALATQLAAQKDSLMTIVLDADKFINQVDSTISRVRGLPKRDRSKAAAEGVLQEQLQFRRDMLFRVDALVKRAEATSRQLAEARRREARLEQDNATMKDSLGANERMIAQLSETLQRQTTQITEMQATIGDLTQANSRLSEELSVTLASSARVYYIIGREDELLRQGVIVREGGMNLLVARAGRTVQPARYLDASKFTTIDAREVSRIPVPDSTKQYRVVSRQSLDHAEVQQRKASDFRGDLRITDAEKFWAPSRYLIIVER